MEKNKILGYVGMGAGALMIISVFLPYVSAFSSSVNLWKLGDGSRVIYILLGLLTIALFVFNKKTELGYAAAGYAFFETISHAIANEGLNYLSVGFYFMFVASAALFVVLFMYDESKGAALFNLAISKNPTPNQPVQPQPTYNNQQVQPQQNQPNQNNYPNM